MGLLSMNWIWIALAIGVAFYFLRRSSSANTGGHGTDFRNLLDGPRHAGHGVQPASGSKTSAPEAAVDPVGGEPVSTAKALTSLHQGRVYYFASKENRDRFEASPEEYAGKVAGHARNADTGIATAAEMHKMIAMHTVFSDACRLKRRA